MPIWARGCIPFCFLFKLYSFLFFFQAFLGLAVARSQRQRYRAALRIGEVILRARVKVAAITSLALFTPLTSDRAPLIETMSESALLASATGELVVITHHNMTTRLAEIWRTSHLMCHLSNHLLFNRGKTSRAKISRVQLTCVIMSWILQSLGFRLLEIGEKPTSLQIVLTGLARMVKATVVLDTVHVKSTGLQDKLIRGMSIVAALLVTALTELARGSAVHVLHIFSGTATAVGAIEWSIMTSIENAGAKTNCGHGHF